MKHTIRVVAGIDGLGAKEQFTWDLFPLVPVELTRHLQENGLPKLGSALLPGMILVGFIGQTATFDPARLPSALDIHGLPAAVLRNRLGDMWYNASRYVARETSGIVEEARIEFVDGNEVAVVVTSGR